MSRPAPNPPAGVAWEEIPTTMKPSRRFRAPDELFGGAALAYRLRRINRDVTLRVPERAGHPAFRVVAERVLANGVRYEMWMSRCDNRTADGDIYFWPVRALLVRLDRLPDGDLPVVAEAGVLLETCPGQRAASVRSVAKRLVEGYAAQEVRSGWTPFAAGNPPALPATGALRLDFLFGPWDDLRLLGRIGVLVFDRETGKVVERRDFREPAK